MAIACTNLVAVQSTCCLLSPAIYASLFSLSTKSQTESGIQWSSKAIYKGYWWAANTLNFKCLIFWISLGTP